MAASDNLNPQQFPPLYHGSRHDFAPGDTVQPTYGYANASQSPETAAGYARYQHGSGRGSHVYRVEPNDKTEYYDGGGESGNYRSSKGFKVIGTYEKSPEDLLGMTGNPYWDDK